LLTSGAEFVETIRHFENDSLVRSVEADVRHHKTFLGRRHRGASFAEIQQQPFRVQLSSS
jgi:hypothetical protein